MANYPALIIDAGGIRQVMTGDVLTAPQLQVENGAVDALAFAFSADPDTGFYRVAANSLGIACNGISIIIITATSFLSDVVIRVLDGVVGTPAYAFKNDPDTGFYSVGANQLGIACGGTLIATISTSAFGITQSIRAPDGSVGTPAYSFTYDPDTGIYSSGVNGIGFATNGTQRLGISSTAIIAYTTITSASDTDLTITAASGKNIKLSGQKFPNADGSAGQLLVTDGAGALSWQNRMENGATKWVATDGNDDTGDGSETYPYATITKAFNELKESQFEEGAVQIIQLKEGRYTPTSLTNISEFRGRLRIQGPTSYSFTMSAIVSVANPSGNNYNVRITLDSTTGLAADMFVLITTCTNPISLNGCHKILSVDSSTDITIRVMQTSSSISAGAYSCAVKVPKARIYRNTNIIQFVACLFVDLYDLILEGNASGTALTFTSIMRLYAPTTLGIYNFATAINAISVLRGEFADCGISNLVTGTGLNATASYITFTGAITGCDYAVAPALHATLSLSNLYLGNNTYGVLTSAGDIIYVHTVQVFNNVIGLYADNMSLIHTLYSVTYTNNGTNTSPALNTIGNNNSYIRGPA